MPATTAADIPADDESLRRAYNMIRQPHWPPFEAVMNDAVRARLVRATAWRELNGLPLSALRPPIQRPAVKAPWAPPAPAVLPAHQPAANDRKRAAAGDRDE